MRTLLLLVVLLVVAAGLSLVSSPVRAATPAAACVYVVRAGDTLSGIAATHETNWPSLYATNRATVGSDPNRIFPGESLSVCGAPSAPTPPVGVPATRGASLSGEFCHSTTYGTPAMWRVPPGCYAGIYTPNPHNYPAKPGWGWCNWWPEVLHPSWNIFTLPRHRIPQLGAAIYFVPGDQGASSVGHWGGDVIAITGNWVLISEMNDSWRGGGFGRVNYRYIYLDGGVSFVYP